MLCLVAQSCLTLCNLMDCRLPGSSVPGDSSGKNTWVDFHALLQGVFPTQDRTNVSLQVDSLPSEPPEKPKNTGVGNLSLLWEPYSDPGINQGLLHCRWILYQLSYQGSPCAPFSIPKNLSGFLSYVPMANVPNSITVPSFSVAVICFMHTFHLLIFELFPSEEGPAQVQG